jgi:hypothetical protein
MKCDKCPKAGAGKAAADKAQDPVPPCCDKDKPKQP